MAQRTHTQAVHLCHLTDFSRSAIQHRFLLPLEPVVSNHAHQNGEQRTAGRSKTHGQQRLREELGCEVGTRHAHQQNGQRVMQEGQPGRAKRSAQPSHHEFI